MKDRKKTWPLRILATRTTEPLAALRRFGPESRLMLLIVGTASPSASTLYCPVHMNGNHKARESGSVVLGGVGRSVAHATS